MLLLSLLFACKPSIPDLAEPLGPDEARAGIVETDQALFGGISAEGRIGDTKIYNSKARFVIQGDREGSFYIQQRGMLIDADITRPANQPGRDLVDEWGGMFGLGRLVDGRSIEVMNDGSDGESAWVRVSGDESPMALVTGALEADIILNKGTSMVTDYRLEPNSPFLHVETTLTADTQDIEITVGDILMASLDASNLWVPGQGLDFSAADEWPWIGFVGRRNELAIGIFSESSQMMDTSGGGDLLLELATMAVAMQDTVELKQGESYTFGRFYGVGRDFASLTDAWQDKLGNATTVAEGTVTAPDGPVAGARVNILVEEQPFTLAITDSAGHFSAKVPKGATVTFLAEGQGPGVHMDLPEGYGPYCPYAADAPRNQSLDSFKNGACVVPLAVARGVADPATPLSLGEPGSIRLTVADGLPFTVMLYNTSAAPETDRRLVLSRVVNNGEGAWSRDGDVAFPVAAGSYSLVVHRGLRWELHTDDVVITAGEELDLNFSLTAAYELEDWLIADPHTHASPSGDGSIPMADRLIVMAAAGVQVHFGTDHDHVADYRPLLKPLGLAQVLTSIVSDEVSPVLRGHRNVYPIEPDPEAANGGAWAWWSDRVTTTEEGFAKIRERHPGALIQLNHPTGGGVAAAANWSPGEIGNPSKWTENFDAVEVVNGFGHESFFEFYTDITNRGIRATPTGVSDSHGYTSSGPGLNVTFLHTGHNDPAKLTNEGLKQAMLAGKTVVSMGPFIQSSIVPGSDIVGSTNLEATVFAPNWIQIDALDLLANGVLVDRVENPEIGSTFSFTLAPENDAWYTLIAHGSSPMRPLTGASPWAMTSPIRLDVDGDGWTAPLPPLAGTP
jgi:hypothetical protein